MKTLKMSLDTIQGKLSRAEMKEIVAGCGGCGFWDYPYYCSWSGSGMSGGGYVCASDANAAIWATSYTITAEGIPEVDSVTCG